MNYIDIFSSPSLEPILLSVLQTAIIYCLIIAGLQIVGRRVFAQRSPQDLIIIVLVAESCDLGLIHEDAGFWGTIASVITLLLLGYLTEKIPLIRHCLDKAPITLYSDGKLHAKAMEKQMVDVADLDEVAREEGKSSHKDFDIMVLEGDGQISAIKNKG
jgi:uncharacterized membrane protein YcaP (DUF421 family)